MLKRAALFLAPVLASLLASLLASFLAPLLAPLLQLILAMSMTSAWADDYRSYREAYAGVDWPKSIISIEGCQKRVTDLVARFGFTGAEVKNGRFTGEPNLWVKDEPHHFRIAFGCDSTKKVVTIDIESWQGQTGSAADLLDTLINAWGVP